MQNISQAVGRIQFLDRLSFYCSPNGKIVASAGNQRIQITVDEARELLNGLLARALYFEKLTEQADNHGRI